MVLESGILKHIEGIHSSELQPGLWQRPFSLFSPSVCLVGNGANSQPGRIRSEVPLPSSCHHGGGEPFFVLGKVEKGKEGETQGTGPDNAENADIN